MQKRQVVEPLTIRVGRLLLAGLVLFPALHGEIGPQTQPPQAELREERDPTKRIDRTLATAESAFDSARAAYAKDDVHKGDAELEDMTTALSNCVSSLEAAHKSRLYKRAEMRVSLLQRRLQNLLGDISMTQRGWAEQTGRKLEEIHDKLLEGAMKK